MLESLQYSAGVMFWALVNLILAAVWAGIIGGILGGILLKIFGRKHD